MSLPTHIDYNQLMLNERSRTLLKTLVERYISEGQPVGSRVLSQYSGLDLSPASVRNIMADLEHLGLITSPHTSAGRIPTTRGYRLFVDSMLSVQKLGEAQVREIRHELAPDNPQKLINNASQLLSELTQFAGVVLSKRRTTSFRHIEFIALAETRLLLILVSNDGDVQNRILMTDRAYSPAELVEAANFLNQHYAGKSLDDARLALQAELQNLGSDIVQLMNSALQASSKALQAGDDMVIAGENKLLHVNDLSSNMESLRRLFTAFEQKTELMRLLELSQNAQGVQIFIGGEAEVLPVEACSVITAPYSVNGQLVGTLGVIGPTRMAYDRVIPIVDITARLLSNALSFGKPE